MKIRFITNPSADRGQAASTAAVLRSRLSLPGESTWIFTRAPGEAIALARQAAEDGCETVVAAGGDGTVHEVVNGLMQTPADQRPRLGILPLGSGNDFALAVGVPPQPEAALEVIRAGAVRRVDIGEVRDEHGRQRFWDNTLGIGLDASVNSRSRRVRRARGYLIYLLAALQTILLDHRPLSLRFESEQETWERQVMMLAFCNGHREGGAFLLVPDARPDDGILGYAQLAPTPRWRTVRALFRAMQGTHTSLPEIHLGLCRQARIRSVQPLNVHLDGEVFLERSHGSHALEISLHPGALAVLAPR